MFLPVLICFFLTACSDSPADKRLKAISSANISLSTGDCDSAISTLLDAGVDQTDVTYLRTLSIAYACKANFNVVTLMADDISKFGSVSGSAFGGLTLFSTSDDVDDPTDADLSNMQTAIDYLLYAGGLEKDENPTVAARAAKFSSEDAGEINMQLTYLLMVQLGRYLKYYGNTGTDGIKGSGSGSDANKCFMNYEHPLNLSYEGVTIHLGQYFTLTESSGGLTGECKSGIFTTSGHSGFGTHGNYEIERLCLGVVLMNNFFAIFPAVLAQIAGDDFDSVKATETASNAAKTLVNAAKSGADEKVSNMLSLSKCVEDNTDDDDYLQIYFALMFEVLLI